MNAKICSFKLVRIERRKIRELDAPWGLPTEEVVWIVKQLMEDKGDNQKFARKLYNDVSPRSLKRLESFRLMAKSIRDVGYLTFLDMPLEERRKLFPCSDYDTLPRIHSVNKIDDDRHRCVALLANNIEEALVAYCEPIRIDSDKLQEYEISNLVPEIKQAAFCFLEEEKPEG